MHVALWELGELTAGAVALPAQGKVLSTAEPPAAPRASRGRCSLPPRRGSGVRRQPDPAARAFVERWPSGSAPTWCRWARPGAKAAAVICGEADAYVHSGGQYEWDSAAPVAVARAAGLHASRIDGSPLAYNQDHPSLPDILICEVPLARPLLAAIAAAAASPG